MIYSLRGLGATHASNDSFIYPSLNTSHTTCHTPGAVLSTMDTGISRCGLPQSKSKDPYPGPTNTFSMALLSIILLWKLFLYIKGLFL